MPKAAEVREDRVIQSASIGKDLKRSPESKTHLVQPSVWFLAPLGHPQRVLSSFRTCHDGTLLLPGKAMLPLAPLKFFFFFKLVKILSFCTSNTLVRITSLVPTKKSNSYSSPGSSSGHYRRFSDQSEFFFHL